MKAVVLNNGSMTEPFLVTTRVKQGCVIVPTLFSIYIAAVLHLAPSEPPQVIPLRYRTDCNVFNLARLKAKTKIKSIVARELQYADDAEAGALTEVRLQTTVDVFTEAYRRLGLQVNTRKSKVLYQPAPTPQSGQSTSCNQDPWQNARERAALHLSRL